MIRLILAAAVCVLVGGLAGNAAAAPVSEAVVDEACGAEIESGCTKTTCATGCEKVEGGKLVSYGCVFPNRTGKTKATCARVPLESRAGGTNDGTMTLSPPGGGGMLLLPAQ